MPLVCVLAIAIFIRVTGVAAVLGTVELYLVPFSPLWILLHGADVSMLVLLETGLCGVGGCNGAIAGVHVPDYRFKLLISGIGCIQLFAHTDL